MREGENKMKHDKISGWVLSLLADVPSQEENGNNREHFKHLCWSQYDRISILQADSLKQLCTMSAMFSDGIQKESDTKWYGVERCLHLIPDVEGYSEEFTWILPQAGSSNVLIATENHAEDHPYGFYAVLTMRYVEKISAKRNNGEFYELSKGLRKQVYEKLNAQKEINPELCFYPFLCLDTEDLVIIFLADDMLVIDECVRSMKNLSSQQMGTKIFDSLSVFSGMNDLKCQKNPKLDMVIKLVLRDESALGEIREYLNRTGLIYSIFLRNTCIYLGIEHSDDKDYGEKVLSLYREKEGMLNATSKLYTKIKKSRTYWGKIRKNRDNAEEMFAFEESDLDEEEVLEEENVSRVRNQRCCHNVRNVVAQFILNEYDRLLGTARCVAWHEILRTQEKCIQTFIENYEREQDAPTLCSLLNHVQMSLTYINQACSPVYEVPYHNFYYQGSYHDILKMYYGIISSVFRIGYGFPHVEGTLQHPLCFAVNFEAAMKVKSRMYTIEGSPDRFIVFNLPYDKIFNYAEMLPAIIHEAFHYIAPYDRKSRAENLIRIIVEYIMANFLKCCFPCYDGTMEVSEKEIVYRYYRSKMNQVYESVTSHIKRDCPDFFSLDFSSLYKIFFQNFVDAHAIYREILTCWIKIYSDSIEQEEVYDAQEKNSTDQKGFRKILQKYQISDEEYTIQYKDCYEDIINITLQQFVQYIFDSTKEAFCDMAIIKILNISYEDYFAIIYKLVRDSFTSREMEEFLEYQPTKRSDVYSFYVREYLIAIYFYIQRKDSENTKDSKNKKDSEDKEDSHKNFEVWLSDTFKNIERRFCSTKDQKIYSCFSQHIISKFSVIFEVFGQYIGMLSSMAFEGMEATDFDKIPEISDLVNRFREAYQEKPEEKMCIATVQHYAGYFNSEKPETTFKSLPRKSFLNSFPFHVSNIEEFITEARGIIDKIGKRNHQLWFRGMCNEKFHLLPSLFRKLDPKLSLYTNQANILKYTYERTLSYREVWDRSIIQQMSLLQHYGVATNLLDFSFNLLVALHFALNPDVQDDLKRINTGEYTPAVYIFDPIEYSKAVAGLREGMAVKSQEYDISPVVYDLDEKALEGLFVDKMDYESLRENAVRYSKAYKPCTRKDIYPTPLIVRQDHVRIGAQSGVFLGFSLFAQPQDGITEIKDAYNYLALDIIQERYKEFLKTEGEDEREFLYKIPIASEAAGKIRKDLEYMNITSEKVYPEIAHVLQGFMGRYSDGR